MYDGEVVDLRNGYGPEEAACNLDGTMAEVSWDMPDCIWKLPRSLLRRSLLKYRVVLPLISSSTCAPIVSHWLISAYQFAEA